MIASFNSARRHIEIDAGRFHRAHRGLRDFRTDTVAGNESGLDEAQRYILFTCMAKMSVSCRKSSGRC